MGWFWADSSSTAASAPVVAPHPMPSVSGATPPPGCPMHKPGAAVAAAPPKASPLPATGCPYNPQDAAARKTTSQAARPTAPAPDTSSSSSSPSATSSSGSSTLSKLNPLNYMFFNLSQEKAPNQTVALPTEREPSTIPKGDGTGNWEYPSPQQMYNAMLRKGYTDTPQDAVESMVAVHNFLNEGAWAEIAEWERRFGRGLAQGWRECRRGEAGTVMEVGAEWPDREREPPSLVRFQGRPGELTPKAQLLQLLGRVWPERFGTEPPFDRHDWFVRRCDTDGRCKELRYVIDYYEGPPEPTGEPVFFLDVRPAVDTPTQACERLLRWGGDVWWRATGSGIRQELEAQKKRAA